MPYVQSFEWPVKPGEEISPQILRSIYENGFPAVLPNPMEAERCFEDGIIVSSAILFDALQDNPGAGRSAFLYRYREHFDAGAFGKESQTTGDCVSHGDRNARDTTRSVEILVKNDPEEYLVRGATEPTYGHRGHSGAGMDPYRATRFVVEHGWLGRQNYPGVIDLTTYNSRVGSNWGRSGVPQKVKDLCSKHRVGAYVKANTPDEAMAAMYNGYAGHSGQNIGFSPTPDSRGIHNRRGFWNHDMATVGFDDTKSIWPVRVYFVVNSWGAHNTQWSKWQRDLELQKILGTPITGMIVVEASVWEDFFLGGMYFYTNIEGFKVKTLPGFGTESFLP